LVVTLLVVAACGGAASTGDAGDVEPPGSDSGVFMDWGAMRDASDAPNRDGSLVRDGAPVGPIHAPPLSSTLPTDFPSQVSFLYQGSDAPQIDVTAGALSPRRLAVVRGRALKPDGSPLRGVEVTIAGAPELGRTLTRDDGAFDIAVNGGGTVTVRLQADGYLRVDRSPSPRWLTSRRSTTW